MVPFKDLLSDLARRMPGQDLASMQDFCAAEDWANVPESAQELLNFTPADLMSYVEPIELDLEETPKQLVEKIGVLMGQHGLPRILRAIAINCQNEGTYNSAVSKRFASYTVPLRLTIDYIRRSLQRP